MPLYEYSCPKCGRFEVSQRITEPALKKHSECGSPVEKLISASSFQLKGSGWYSDGYGSSKSASGSACSPSGCDKPGCGAKAALA
jgi:putative FmdB family regulatory protein